jgi:CheY-like chemotaxis protein
MNKTILIIEDEEEILYTLKDFLELEGYQVLTALNGFEAIQLLEKSKMPNLILLDMKMPIMNGWEFAAAFLAKYDHKCPIVITTAAGDAAQRAKDIKANDWISKPFDLDTLLEKIKKNES